MKIIGIYKIINPKGKIYIGQSVDCNDRKRHYSRASCKDQPLIYNSIKKYGWDTHKFEVIHQCTQKELDALEVYYSELYQSHIRNIGLNIKKCGQSNGFHSEETKRKISQSKLGKKRPFESIQKSAETRKKKFANGELVGYWKNKKMPESAKNKMSLSKKGKPTWNKGLTKSDPRIAKSIEIMNNAKKKAA